MPRRIRFVPPGSLVEVTCRTVQGRLLLRPSPILRDLTLGVLARAARLYPVEIHAFAFLSNHFHLLLTVADAQRLAAFMGYLNSNLAREAGRLIRWREKFWGRRYQAILVSSEEESQLARLRYILSHGAKEGLVDSPREWPGAHCAPFLLSGRPIRGRWINHTLEHRASRKGIVLEPKDLVEEETLELASLPCWAHLGAERYRARVARMLEAIESDAARSAAETGRPVAGRAFVERQDPHLEPNRIKKGPAPLIHAVSRQVRRDFREAYSLFLAAYRRASDRFRQGCLDVSFPDGSFPPALPFRAAAPAT
ncbi:MAG TPA: transposase [Thermoanaerobaculia bacterium]|nr:transposase [Thermoanaerobaculia bacterium]